MLADWCCAVQANVFRISAYRTPHLGRKCSSPGHFDFISPVAKGYEKQPGQTTKKKNGAETGT